MTKDNALLGKFTLEDLPPAPRGVPKIEVTFDVDANGIMNVTAMDKTTLKSSRVTITNEKGRLSKDDVERLIKEAESSLFEDEALKKKVEAKNSLESYCYNIKNTLKEEGVKSKMTPDEVQKVEAAVTETLKWIEINS